jgi:hypothetical protein
MDAYTPAGSNPKALKILKSTDPSTGKKTYYYLSTAQRWALIAAFERRRHPHRVGIERQQQLYLGPSSPRPRPPTRSWTWARATTDPSTGVTITTTQVTSSSAAVQVAFGPQPCAGEPSAALSPATSQWVPGGTTINYAVTVTNNDSAGCSMSDFNSEATVTDSTGNRSVDGPSVSRQHVDDRPGSNASTSLAVTSPTSASDGFYSIAVTATNSKYNNETARFWRRTSSRVGLT